jgi:hypothetical protein
MKKWIAFCLAASLGITLALPATAQWKWRDRNGVQYSDLPPPPGVTEADVLQRPPGTTLRNAPAAPAAAPPASAPSLPPKAAEPELEAKKRKADEEEASKKKAAAAAEETRLAADKADNCTRAQSQLRNLEGGTRLSQINEKGERVFMEDPERAQETKRTKEIVAASCK